MLVGRLLLPLLLLLHCAQGVRAQELRDGADFSIRGAVNGPWLRFGREGFLTGGTRLLAASFSVEKVDRSASSLIHAGDQIRIKERQTSRWLSLGPKGGVLSVVGYDDATTFLLEKMPLGSSPGEVIRSGDYFRIRIGDRTRWLNAPIGGGLIGVDESGRASTFIMFLNEVTPTYVTWRSRNSSLHQLTDELGELYLTLIRSGVLPQSTYKNEEGELPMRFAATKGAVLGCRDCFNRKLDEVLCQLNRHICTRTPNEATHQSTWRGQKGDPITLPNLYLERTVSYLSYAKARGGKLEREIERRGSCDRYDDNCKRLIRQLNGGETAPPNIFEDSYEGALYLPTVRLRAEILVPADSEKRALLLKALAKHLSPEGVASPEQGARSNQLKLSDETVSDRVSLLRTLVNWTPEIADLVNGGSPLLIIEGEFERNNCVLAGHTRKLKWHPAYPDANTRKPEDGCPSGFTESDLTSEDKPDHGTHVTSVLAGPVQARHVLSLLPKAKIIGLALPRMFASVDRFEQILVDSYQQVIDDEYPPLVVNMSWSFPRLQAKPKEKGTVKLPVDWHETMVQAQWITLFVAAAGNVQKRDGKIPAIRRITDFGSCNIIPACLNDEVPNLISVVALDDSKEEPRVRADSFSGLVFDLGAPGAQIPGAVTSHRVGFMSGTSQATAMVSAAAMVLAKASNGALKPAQVRTRLITSSDLYPNLDDFIFGGRLNIGRALEWQSDQIEIATWEGVRMLVGGKESPIPANAEKRIVGELVGLFRLPSVQLAIELEPRDARVHKKPTERVLGTRTLEWRYLLRLHRRADPVRTAVVYYQRGKTAPLERFIGTIGDPWNSLVFQIDLLRENQKVTYYVPVASVKEFTSSSGQRD